MNKSQTTINTTLTLITINYIDERKKRKVINLGELINNCKEEMDSKNYPIHNKIQDIIQTKNIESEEYIKKLDNLWNSNREKIIKIISINSSLKYYLSPL